MGSGASLALSPQGSEWPLSLGGGRVFAAARLWLTAQGPACQGSFHSTCLHSPGVRGHSRGAPAGAECHQSCVLPFVQHLEQLRVLGALAALSSRVVEHGQGAAMLVRGIAKPPAGFAGAKLGLWQFCIGAAEPCSGLGALLTWPRVLTHTHPGTQHSPISPT